jgi:hypothetical protein|tara:strand:- start:73 stop:438 length:366 start_codon:yes stop_codon:yes gene_type:complete
VAKKNKAEIINARKNGSSDRAALARLSRKRGRDSQASVADLLRILFFGRARVYEIHHDRKADPEGGDLMLRIEGEGIATPMIQVKGRSNLPKWFIDSASSDGYGFIVDIPTGHKYFIYRMP